MEMVSVHELQLSIVSPAATYYDGVVKTVQIPTSEGLIGVLPGHAPLLALLGYGLLTLRDSTGEKQYLIEEGFVEINNNHVVVLANAAEDLAKVTFEKAQAEYENALAIEPDDDVEAQEKEEKLRSARNKMRFTRP